MTNIIRRPAAKPMIYTMGSPGAQQAAPGTSQRIVVLKSSSGGLQAVSPAALTPAILEALKKQGVNVGALKGTFVVPQSSAGGLSQPISLTSLLTKTATAAATTTTTAVTAEPETTQSSEASEAAAALMSSMQEEGMPSTSTQFQTIASTTPFQTTPTTIQFQTVPSTVQFQSTSTSGVTSLLSQGSGIMLPGHVLTTSSASSTSGVTDPTMKSRSLLSTVLTSAEGPKPVVVKPMSTNTSPSKVTLGAQGSMFRIMSSGGKAIQVLWHSSGYC